MPRPTRMRLRTPPSFALPLVAILLLLSLSQCSYARIVKVLAQDTPKTNTWLGPVVFDFIPGDQSGGGPNSSVCVMGEETMYTLNNGATFDFTFRGVAVQVVMTSRPDHGAMSVALDNGAPTLVNTYSLAPACGVVWSRAGLALGEHTVTGTAQLTTTRAYLELMSVLYDDGSDLQPNAPPTTSLPARASTSNPTSLSSSTNSATLSSATPSSSAEGPSSSGNATATTSDRTSGSATVESSTSEVMTTSESLPPLSTVTSKTGLIDKATRSHTRSIAVPIGIAVSAMCAIILLSTFIWCMCRRRKRRTGVQSVYMLPSMIPETAANPPSRAMRDVKLRPESSIFEAQSPTSASHIVVSEAGAATRAVMPVSVALAPEDIDRIALRMHDMLAANGERGDLPPYGGSQL